MKSINNLWYAIVLMVVIATLIWWHQVRTGEVVEANHQGAAEMINYSHSASRSTDDLLSLDVVSKE